MERYLITQTLLSSWAYVFNCWEGTEEDAMSDFLRTLKREPSEPTDAMLEGIEFENEVYAAASGKKREPHAKWESGIQLVATFLRGAQTQVKAQRDIRVHGMDFLVYGILDGLRAGVIFDVKKRARASDRWSLRADISRAHSTRHISTSCRKHTSFSIS